MTCILSVIFFSLVLFFWVLLLVTCISIWLCNHWLAVAVTNWPVMIPLWFLKETFVLGEEFPECIWRLYKFDCWTDVWMAKNRHITIYTTASLPWMTGTAVNPLLRACYLAKDGETKVTLVLPWLSQKDQGHVYPDSIKFKSVSEHEAYIRKWLEDRTRFISQFDIRFYPGKVNASMWIIYSFEVVFCSESIALISVPYVPLDWLRCSFDL